MTTTTMTHDEAHHHDAPKGWRRWLFSTNHKDIGTLYLLFALTMLFLGGASAMLIRMELFQPGIQLLQPDLYNNLVTNHALIMIFGAVMPAAAGLANWMIPMMIGAPDMALPRMNNLSFWILPAAATMLVLSFIVPFFPGGGTQINTGWTLYPPLSIQVGMSMDFLIFAIHLLGISSVLASINIIVTLLNMRAPGMTLFKMPIFCWSWLVTALLLPSIGVLSHVIPAFSRKPLFGYNSMVGAMLAVATIGMVVWAHHQYTIGMSLGAVTYFMIGTILISIPVGLMIFNFIATMWRGAMTFETPMLFAVAIILMFTFGGLSGVMLAVVPADMQYQDSMFVVAHFHYVLMPGAVFGLFAGVFYWLPKWTGHMYDEKLGKLFFWINVIGFNITFFPQHFLGLAGMPRRIVDYNVMFTEFNVISSIGAMIFGLSHLLLLYIIIKTIRGGKKAESRAWEGAKGLEWELDSPPAFHTWTVAPQVK
ncbi:MAG: cbb3-type cytochrome c oxidase subunit I [Candidatus Thiodiazotropha sp.]